MYAKENEEVMKNIDTKATRDNISLEQSNTFVLIPGNYDLLPSIKANVDISDDPFETVCMNMTEETKKLFINYINKPESVKFIFQRPLKRS